MDYKTQLQDPRWKQRRLQILRRDEFTCKGCGASDQLLHVHHKRYIEGRMAWEYSDSTLISLCENCHSTIHTIDDAYRYSKFERKEYFYRNLFSDTDVYEKSVVYKVYRIFPNPHAKGCLIVHIPSGYWHGFTLQVHEALEMLEADPTSVDELRELILKNDGYET